MLVLSADGKGIVMRPDALRPATAKAAASATTKLSTRLSKGEKRNRKRLAEVGAVYDVDPVVRTPADILARRSSPEPSNRPRATGRSPGRGEQVADRQRHQRRRHRHRPHLRRSRPPRPHPRRTWIALVDGNNHQIDRIQAEATHRGVDMTILCDFIHVLEYLWKAAWSFHHEGDPAAEEWVRDKALAVLEGKATRVAAGLRRPPPAEG